MKNLVLGTTAALALMATGSFAQTSSTTATFTIDTMVKLIEVSTDLDAVQNAEAATVWANIDQDLAAAITNRLEGHLGSDGADIVIDIDEVSLATSFEQAIGTEDAYLKGDVLLRIPGPENNQNYTLTVSSLQAQAYYPDGTQIEDITQGSAVYYAAMIDAFADNVVRNLFAE